MFQGPRQGLVGTAHVYSQDISWNCSSVYLSAGRGIMCEAASGWLGGWLRPGLSRNTGMAGFLSFSIRLAPLQLTPPEKNWTYPEAESPEEAARP